jgi:hypothetical protein
MAGTLASGALLAPLAPGQSARLSFAMPPGFAVDQEVWLVHELVALSSADGDSGEVALEQSFEGVKTPLNAFYVVFHADKMDSKASAGTIARLLEQVAGGRGPEELRRDMGAELYAAFAAANAGSGRVLGGRVVSHLPAPGKSDVPLQVSVERAQGMQPLALRVTVGQGQLPPEFQPKVKDFVAYKVGYALGLALFGWLVLRFFRRRK